MIWKNVLKNVAIPVFTLFTVNSAHLISDAVVTETDSLQHIGFFAGDLAMEVAKGRLGPAAELVENSTLDNRMHIKAG